MISEGRDRFDNKRSNVALANHISDVFESSVFFRSVFLFALVHWIFDIGKGNFFILAKSCPVIPVVKSDNFSLRGILSMTRRECIEGILDGSFISSVHRLGV